MTYIQRYQTFSKEEFENLLNTISPYTEFPEQWYASQQLEDIGYQGNPTREYGYLIPLRFNPNIRLIKIYSSIQKGENYSRRKGSDAIRVVLADLRGEPKYQPLSRVNRTGNWKKNLQLRISEVIGILGFNVTCPKCNAPLFLKRKRNNKKTFLGCSEWKINGTGCDGSRPFQAINN